MFLISSLILIGIISLFSSCITFLLYGSSTFVTLTDLIRNKTQQK